MNRVQCVLRKPSTLIGHLKQGFSSSVVSSYQIRSNKELHCQELTKEGNYKNTGKKMSAQGDSAGMKDDETTSDKRPQFGNRYLSNPDNVFQHNAWDNVAWDPEQLEAAKKKVDNNSKELVEQEKIDSYEAEADEYWNKFYSQHQNKFFKDRHWLFTEFPELSSDNGQTPGKESTHADEVKTCADSAGAESTQDEGVRETVDTECVSVQEGGVSKETSGARCSSLDNSSVGDAKTPENGKCAESAVGTEVNPQDCINHIAMQRTSPEEQGMRESGGMNDVDFPGKSAEKRIMEVGCGVGNTIFPILQTNADPRLFVYGCDFSSVAVDIVQQHAEYDPSRCHAFVCDISDESATFPFPENTLDVISVIFVLSAINPDRFQTTIQTLSRFLKPGGRILFRDYGRYDMAQLRFKKGRCLSDNFYVRGDGTRVYFFTQEELRTLFAAAGLVEEQNVIDRRLQVNRGRQLTMYRVWIQCKYRKP